MSEGSFYIKEPADMQVVVLMGGLGTRLKEYTKECPKPLVDVEGRPFFDYSLKLLMHHGFRKFLFLIGYRAEMIEEYYGDGSRLGISVTYCYDGKELLGTGGAVRRAYGLLEDDFLLMYGDSFMDIDYEETLYRYFEGKSRGMRALMTVLKNGNRFDKSNVVMDGTEIKLYDKMNMTPEMDYIDYGVCVYEKSLFEDEYLKDITGIPAESGAGENGGPADIKFDIALIQNRLSLDKKIAAHIVTKRFYEIGSPGALNEFKGYVKYRFNEMHPAVFLDRDGVLNEIVFNEDAEQMDSPQKVEQFKAFPEAAKAIKIMKEKGYYVFLATNQPGAAKGKCKLKTLYDINTMFVEQMAGQGADIDGVFMCPHYPSVCENTKEGFLIKKCDCRKPKPGLLLKPGDIYNIDYDNSFMVGDSFTDIVAGQAAGVNTIFIGELKCDACRKLCDAGPTGIVRNVTEAAEFIPDTGKGK
ncbi:MAG: HAD-IIIA family hydrolase [Lachnospiraceae bacterium]|nr:HAD-IIIA family hydrolase [Lachnospiraceae bacterium]